MEVKCLEGGWTRILHRDSGAKHKVWKDSGLHHEQSLTQSMALPLQIPFTGFMQKMPTILDKLQQRQQRSEIPSNQMDFSGDRGWGPYVSGMGSPDGEEGEFFLGLDAMHRCVGSLCR